MIVLLVTFVAGVGIGAGIAMAGIMIDEILRGRRMYR